MAETRPAGRTVPHLTADELHDSVPVRSWSQYKTYLACPTRWWLSKIRRLPRRPGVWLPAGTAVHAVIEQYLIEQTVTRGWRSFDYES